MSAFVVSTAHIDTIVSAAIDLELFAARTDHGTLERVCHETATASARCSWPRTSAPLSTAIA